MRNPNPGFFRRLLTPKERPVGNNGSNEDELENQEEQEERQPEIPMEVLKRLEEHDAYINREENRYNALGQIAREIYQYDLEKKEDITSVKIGQDRKLRGEKVIIDPNDQAGFELESKPGVVNKFLAFVKGESRHRVEATPSKDSKESSVLDKRKLAVEGKKFRVKHRENTEDFIDEKLEVSEADVSKINFYKKFEKVDDKIIETLSRDRAESEQLERARDLIKGDIERINNKFGAGLIADKEALEKHDRSKEEATKLLASLPTATRMSISEKLESEEKALQEKVNLQKEALEVELVTYRKPLEGKEQELLNAVNECSGILQNIDTEVQAYTAKIRELTAGIKKAQSMELIGGIQAEIVKALEDQKKETDLILAQFNERKSALENRLKELKKQHGEVADTLTDLNNIGKTKAEIRREKEEEERRRKEIKEKDNKTPAPGEKNSADAEDKKPKLTIKLEEFGYPESDDYAEEVDDSVPQEGVSSGAELDAASQEKSPPAKKTENQPKVVEDVVLPATSEEVGAEKKEKKEIKKSASVWLELIKRAVGKEYEKEIKNNVLHVGKGDKKHYENKTEFFINPSGRNKTNLFSRLVPFLKNTLKYNEDQVRNALETIEKEVE